MTSNPRHDIAHLGSVELFTPEPERSLWFFRHRLEQR
jgi:catechol 2,3-dioxygenase